MVLNPREMRQKFHFACAALCTVLATLLMITACKDPATATPDDSFSQSHVEDYPLLFVLKIDVPRIDSLQDLEAVFSVRNLSSEDVILEFTTTCEFGYTIEKNGDILYESLKNSGCRPAWSQHHYLPDATYLYNISTAWLSTDIAENASDGTYQLKAFMAEGNSPAVSTSFYLE